MKGSRYSAPSFGLLLILSIGSLLLGGMIYLLFRPDSLKMFTWVEWLHASSTLDGIRANILDKVSKLPNWFLYALPNGLWTFSFSCLLLWIWEGRLHPLSLLWILALPLGAMFLEVGQISGIVPGTFDGLDLLFYFIGAGLPVLSIFYSYNLQIPWK